LFQISTWNDAFMTFQLTCQRLHDVSD